VFILHDCQDQCSVHSHQEHVHSVCREYFININTELSQKNENEYTRKEFRIFVSLCQSLPARRFSVSCFLKSQWFFTKFEVLTVIGFKVMVFVVCGPCTVVDSYQHFGGDGGKQIHLKHWHLSTRLQGVALEKIILIDLCIFSDLCFNRCHTNVMHWLRKELVSFSVFWVCHR
jgi:hypothetical protein